MNLTWRQHSACRGLDPEIFPAVSAVAPGGLTYLDAEGVANAIEQAVEDGEIEPERLAKYFEKEGEAYRVTRLQPYFNPGPDASIFKLYWSEYHKVVTELAVDIVGAEYDHDSFDPAADSKLDFSRTLPDRDGVDDLSPRLANGTGRLSPSHDPLAAQMAG